MKMHGVHHPRTRVHKLYMKKCNGGRELISVRERFISERRNMEEYFVNSKQDIISKQTWYIIMLKQKNLPKMDHE